MMSTPKLAANPLPTGSDSAANTIGIVRVRSLQCGGRLRVGKGFLHECSIGRCGHVFGLYERGSRDR